MNEYILLFTDRDGAEMDCWDTDPNDLKQWVTACGYAYENGWAVQLMDGTGEVLREFC